MTQIILIILGLAVVAILLTRKGRALLRPAKAGLRMGTEKAVGICAAALGLDSKKRERKGKILALLGKSSAFAQGSGETKELSNSDIREALGISERSAVRYMDELEKENKVEQVGNTGRGVLYRLK